MGRRRRPGRRGDGPLGGRPRAPALGPWTGAGRGLRRQPVSNEYVIAEGQPGFDRLRVLARVWGATTESLLRSVGVGAGMRCLDVGCGAGDVTMLLASMVGPAGAVVGSDADRGQLDLVEQEVERLGVTTVELVHQDVMDLAASGEYDVVYSRFLLEDRKSV